MMGFGHYGNGGSSSASSNLSALAPPFTVCRPVSHPTSNPVVNFIMNEPPPPPPPYGGTTYNSSLHSWVPSNPASMPDYYTNFAADADSMPPPSVNSYLVPQAINSPDTHIPPLNAGAIDATGSFSYGQYTDNSVTTTAVDEVNPYYPSYDVSPAIKEKNPLVGLGDPTYDFLSACCLAPTDGTSQYDYTKSLSGWGSSTRWDGSWNGSTDLESGKCTDSDWSFYSNKTNVAGSSICHDYVKPGSGLFKGFSTSGKTCAVSHGVDVLGRENRMGSVSTNRTDGKSFMPPDLEFSPFQSATSGALHSGAVSTSVSPGIQWQATSLESVTNSPSSTKSYNAKYDKFSRQHDTCLDIFTSATKSTPALVSRPPAGGACSSQQNMISSIDWNYNGTDVVGQNEDCSRKRLSSLNNPHVTLSFEGNEVCTNPSRFSIYLKRNGQDVADTSSTGPLSSNQSITNDAFTYLSKATEFHVPQTSSPDRFPLVVDESKVSDSVENSSKILDPYNPAEDSPCWKGATSSRFSPFEISEAVAPQHLTERSESCGGSSPHGPQILPMLSNEAVRDISQKLSEIFVCNQNGSMENGSSPSMNWPSLASYSYGENMLNSAKAGSFIPEQSCDGALFSNTVEASKEEPAVPNNNKIDPDYRPSNIMKPFQEVSFTSEKSVSGTCFAKTEMNPNDASENGLSHVPIHTTEDVLSPLCGDNALSKLPKMHAEESTSNINVPALVKTMHNLSDLLRFYCLNDACGLKEQDHVALKHAINNLNACILKSPQLTLKRDSVFSPQGITDFLGESPVLHQGASVDRVHVTEIAAALSAMDELDNQRIHEGKRHNILPGGKDEKFRDLALVHNDAETVKSDGMAQAIKKVFVDNFHGEEETQPQVLLYKNLWLEAEAEICSTNFRARFDRMKNEMEKSKPHKAKDVSENMMDDMNLSHSKGYPDVITVNKLASDRQSGVQDSPIISTTSHAADVMARFHMLKCRDDNSTSMDTADATKFSNADVFPNLKDVYKLAPQASDSFASEIYVEGSPTSSKTSHEDDVEDSVMARFHILKCRVDNSTSMVMGGQQLPGVVDLGFVGKKKHSPDTRDGSEDGTFKMTMGHDLQHPIDDCTEEKSTVNETSLFRNDKVIQSCGTDELGNQHRPGWYDSSSLDWEHVLKDDFVWQN